MIVIQYIKRHKYNDHYFLSYPFIYNSENVENINQKPVKL